MKDNNSTAVKFKGGIVYTFQRIIVIMTVFFSLLAMLNPARIAGAISDKVSLFTSAISYESIVENFRQLMQFTNIINESTLKLDFCGAIIAFVGVLVCVVGPCASLGNIKCKRFSLIFSLIGSVIIIAGCAVTLSAYLQIKDITNADVAPRFPVGAVVFIALAVVNIILSVIACVVTPKAAKSDKMEMESKYSLFLMFLPFALLCFVFSYLPLWGWRYSFFDYKAGQSLTKENFVGLKWFTYLFQNASTRADIVRVLRNTLVMSGLGILTSWLPLAFAIFLTELGSKTFKRLVQTFTTIPNFISWILVYTVAFAIFSTDGFINSLLTNLGSPSNTNYLMSSSGAWIKMLLWGTWKGIGWSAIIYIAGIAGIDRQLYEAATVDGAGRFQRIWHVTVPGLMPTYMVMLLMSVAGMLSNGLDQYLVFSNANNMSQMEVLDLYVYKIGIAGGNSNIPLSTVVGMAKSIVSVALLFMANGVSKMVRKESII